MILKGTKIVKENLTQNYNTIKIKYLTFSYVTEKNFVTHSHSETYKIYYYCIHLIKS